jgi:hypothetical protein
VLQEKKLEAGLFAGLPKHFTLAEDFRDRADNRDHLIRQNKGIEPHRQMRIGGKPAPNAHRKSQLAVIR